MAQPRSIFQKTNGVVLAAFGCAFGVLGIFLIGIIFVPLAAIFTLLGLARAATGPSFAGLAVSLLSAICTATGFLFSPTLWILFAQMTVASQAALRPASPPQDEKAADAGLKMPHFDFNDGDDALPKTGALSWCNQKKVQQNLVLAFDQVDDFRDGGAHVVKFENPYTISLVAKDAAAACRGTLRLSNGRTVAGVFSVSNGRWNWKYDDFTQRFQKP